ncbi:hypothetical protein ACWCXK_38890, partial [Streptomyces sp. NPDC001739]
MDTPSLDVVARNIESLKAPVKDAMDRLRQVRVAPGSFYAPFPAPSSQSTTRSAVSPATRTWRGRTVIGRP